MTWRSGQSGNPRGRPKAAFDLAVEARKFAPLALDTLVRCLRDPKKDLPAAVHLLDRAYGKPVQAIAAADQAASLTFLHLVAARAFGEQQRVIEGAVDTQRNDSTSVDTAKPADINTPALE